MPVRISVPPMMSGMSIFSAAIDFSRAFSSARSGEPGAYERLASLIGCGTRRTPANAAIGAPVRPLGACAGVVSAEL